MGCRSSKIYKTERQIETIKKFIENDFFESGINLSKKCLEYFNSYNLQNFYIFKLFSSLIFNLKKVEDEKLKIILMDWYILNIHPFVFFSKNGYLYDKNKQIYPISFVRNLKKICIELLKMTYSPDIHFNYFEYLDKIVRIAEFDMKLYFEHSGIEIDRDLFLLNRINKIIEN